MCTEKSERELRLFAFKTETFGPKSFFVMARSANEARELVNKYVMETSPIYKEDWPYEYDMEEVSEGIVIENDNN